MFLNFCTSCFIEEKFNFMIANDFFFKSWDYNYKAASFDLFGDDRLLRNPEQVATNDEIAWSTTFWYWKKNVHSAPGVQNGQFGSSTNAINGFLECRGSNSDKARKRFEIYKKCLLAFGCSDAPNESGCY